MPSAEDEIRRAERTIRGYHVLATQLYSPGRDAFGVVEEEVEKRSRADAMTAASPGSEALPEPPWEVAVELLLAFRDWVDNVTPDWSRSRYDQVRMRIAIWERRLEELRDEEPRADD